MITEAEIQVTSILRELHGRGDTIRQSELAKLRKRMGSLTAEQQQALDAVTSAIVRRVLLGLLAGAPIGP